MAATASAHAGALELAAPVLVIPGGEQSKNDHGADAADPPGDPRRVLDRHSYVAAIGGGAVLDVAGYAAATAHRGIRLIRFPTTVLAQDDSAVGVKNGINAFGKKNYLGTFAPPFAVINDSTFLTTLLRPRLARRAVRSDQGGAHQGSHVLRLHRGARRGARTRAT